MIPTFVGIRASATPTHWCARVVERWPTWFNTGGDIKHTLMPRDFTHDDRWFDILWWLCEDLEPLVRETERAGGRQFEVLQVKEKFRGLRIHVNNANDAIRQRIEAAKLKSLPGGALAELESSLGC